MATGSGLRVGILVFDDVEELDVVGPYDVLAAWAGISALHPNVLTFSPDGVGVRCAKGLRLLPDTSIEELGALHVLIHPGGVGTRRMLQDHDHLDWLRSQRAQVPLLASVCTGALVYAAAGLLAGRPVATYWSAFDELLGIDPSIQPDREARFVDDGDIITSAGVSAGIDMALHLVRRLEGVEMAREVRRAIQYDPAPPI